MVIPDFSKKDKDSLSFLKKLIEQFESKNPIDLSIGINSSFFSYQNYVTGLFKHLEDTYISNKNVAKFKDDCNRLFQTYDISNLSFHAKVLYIDTLLYYGEIDLAISEWIKLTVNNQKGRESQVTQIIEFEQHKKKSVVNGALIRIIADEKTQLTDFGKRNFNQISSFIDNYINESYKISFFEEFFSNYSFDFRNKKTYPFEYYAKFFESNKSQILQWKHYLENKSNSYIKKDGTLSLTILHEAIINKASAVLRECENQYRLSINSKKIGEAWISETELYYNIKSHYKNIEVIQHGKPDWLGRQHFDVWIPSLKIAIEYQGKQHDKPIDFFGGENAFVKNQERDLKKKNLAEKHKVLLIEVRNGYQLEQVIEKINKEIEDKS
jgi:hypothetical protein